MPLSTALLIAGALLVLAIVVGFALRMLDGRRRSAGALQLQAEDLSAPLAPTATLVQFSTEVCARCPQVRRLLTEIAAGQSGIAHAEIDLTARPDLATRYRVLQTPTTFLVDASRNVLSRWGGVPDPRAINEALIGIADRQPQEQK